MRDLHDPSLDPPAWYVNSGYGRLANNVKSSTPVRQITLGSQNGLLVLNYNPLLFFKSGKCEEEYPQLITNTILYICKEANGRKYELHSPTFLSQQIDKYLLFWNINTTDSIWSNLNEAENTSDFYIYQDSSIEMTWKYWC